jgi:GT2 family glycosyltransferase
MPVVHTLKLSSNMGFAGATNAGSQIALERGAELILWLNSDATMAPGSVSTLASYLVDNPKAAAASPAVMTPNEAELQHTTCSFLDRQRLWGVWDSHGLDGPPLKSEWLSGEAMLVRAAALRTIGPLNEDLFFWAEDLDWSLRATERGYELWCVPESRCAHAVAASSTSTIRDYFASRNLLILLRIHSGRSRFGVLRLATKQLYWQTKCAAREKRFRSFPFIFHGTIDGLSTRMRRRYPR